MTAWSATRGAEQELGAQLNPEGGVALTIICPLKPLIGAAMKLYGGAAVPAATVELAGDTVIEKSGADDGAVTMMVAVTECESVPDVAMNVSV